MTASSAKKIMEHLRMKEQVMGSIIKHIPTSYIGGTPGNVLSLITQSSPTKLERIHRTDPIIPTPWVAAVLDPANSDDDKLKYLQESMPML